MQCSNQISYILQENSELLLSSPRVFPTAPRQPRGCSSLKPLVKLRQFSIHNGGHVHSPFCLSFSVLYSHNQLIRWVKSWSPELIKITLGVSKFQTDLLHFICSPLGQKRFILGPWFFQKVLKQPTNDVYFHASFMVQVLRPREAAEYSPASRHDKVDLRYDRLLLMVSESCAGS